MNDNQSQLNICILGGYSFENYGDEITYYSLYTYLSTLKYNVKMLPWPRKYKRYYKEYLYPSKMWEPCKTPQLFKNNPYSSNILNIVDNRSELSSYDKYFDIFLVGSGQYFNARVLNNIRYYTLLDWTHKKKIAYSAAWGNGDYSVHSSKEKEVIKKCINNFDAFSVREEQSVISAKKEFNIDVNQVIDPVFLCDISIFSNISLKPEGLNLNSSYIFSYMLDSSMINGECINKFVTDNDIDIKCVCAESMHDISRCQKNWPLIIEQNVSVEEWLWYIQHCKMMITDSFHGMCMAIIFNKPFVVITRPLAGNDRYSSLLGRLGLISHVVNDPKEIMKTKINDWVIDYDKIQPIISDFVAFSKRWIDDALSSPNENKAELNIQFSDATNLDEIIHYYKKMSYESRLFNLLRKAKGAIRRTIKNVKKSGQENTWGR